MKITHPTIANSNKHPARVLVAEDDDKTRIALVALLQMHGFEVTVAADGQTALDVLRAPDPPQIALLDWEMPHLDGLNVCRAVRAMPQDDYNYVYIVLLTARDAAGDVLAAFAAGVDDFLSKPVGTAELLARLHCGERIQNLKLRCHQRIADLEQALGEVRQLQRLMPLCMYCKKIRNDDDYWQEIESYLLAHAGGDFSHGICPTCMESVLRRDLSDDPVEREAMRNA